MLPRAVEREGKKGHGAGVWWEPSRKGFQLRHQVKTLGYWEPSPKCIGMHGQSSVARVEPCSGN